MESYIVQIILGATGCLYGSGLLMAGLADRKILARGQRIQGTVLLASFKKTLYWPGGAQRAYSVMIAVESGLPIELDTGYAFSPGQRIALVHCNGEYHICEYWRPLQTVMLGGASIIVGLLLLANVLMNYGHV